MSEERDAIYWEGYRASLMDVRVALAGGKEAGWTMTADVEALMELIDKRLDGLSRGDDDIPFSDEPRFRATDPFGGRGPDGGFPVATSYSAIVVDNAVTLVKAGLLGDSFEPAEAAAFGEHIIRCGRRAGLPETPA